MTNLYALLGIGKRADLETIKRNYRRLSMHCHPDKHPNDPGAAEKFRAITEAFEVLSDPEQRAEYDATGQVPRKSGPTLRTAALTVISGVMHAVLQQIIANDSDPAERDLVELMRIQLREVINKGDEEIKRLKEVRATLVDVAARFVSPDVPLDSMAKAPLEKVGKSIELTQQQRIVCEEAIKILQSARFNAKRRDVPTAMFYLGGGSRMGTTTI